MKITNVAVVRSQFSLEENEYTSFDELADACREHRVVASKLDARAFVPAVFDYSRPCPDDSCDGTRPHRHSCHVSALTAFVVDLDTVSDDQLAAFLEVNAARSWFAYSSFSYTPDTPCCRVVFELDTPVKIETPRRWSSEVWPALLRLVGLSIEQVDRKCSDAPRCYFFPSVRNENSPRFFRRNAGEPIRTSEVLAALGPEKLVSTVLPHERRDTPAFSPQTVERALIKMHAAAWAWDAWVIDCLRIGSLPEEGKRHELILKGTRLLAEIGGDENTLEDVFANFVVAGLREQPDRDWKTEIRNAYQGAVRKIQSGEFSPADETDDNEREYADNDLAVFLRWKRMFAADFLASDAGVIYHWTGTGWSSTQAEQRWFESIAAVGDEYEREREAQLAARLVVQQKFNALTVKALSSDSIEPTEFSEADSAKKNLEACDKKIKLLARHAKYAKSKNLLTGGIVAGVLNTAKVDELDQNVEFLPVKNGVVRLSDGELLPHDRRLLYTSTLNVEYQRGSADGEFAKFLSEIQPAEENRVFLQKLFGQILASDSVENVFPIFVGRGANGKSAFVTALAGVLGDAVAHGDPASIGVRRFGSDEYELASYRGKRLVVFSELPSTRLDSQRVKRLTGRDTIQAREPYGKKFSYRPTFTMLATCNDLPKLEEGDGALAQRLLPVSFDQDFSKQREDGVSIPKRLFGAENEILNWLVEGYQRYRAEGLGRVTSVLTAKQEWLADNADVGDFVDGALVLLDGARTPDWLESKSLYEAYDRWCQDIGWDPVTKETFGKRIRRYMRTGKIRSNGKTYLPCRLK